MNTLLGGDLFTPEKINKNGMFWQPSMFNRMNQRAKRIFTPNFDHIAGKSILDLGSRSGWWSWAAIQLGANFTLGVEGRRSSVEKGKHLFENIGLDKHRCVVGNVFDVLPNLISQGYHFDTILCLGFYYHIYDHYGLLKLMDAFRPQHIVIDSEMEFSQETTVWIRREKVHHPNNAITEFEGQVIFPAGNITTATMELLSECMNYKIHWCSWDLSEEDKQIGCEDYFEKRRFTCILTK